MRLKKKHVCNNRLWIINSKLSQNIDDKCYKIMNTTDNTKNIGILSNRLSSILKILIIIKISIFILYTAQD